MSDVTLVLKVCTKCREPKPLSGFSRDRGAKDGRYPWCKVCHLAGVKASKQRRIERLGEDVVRSIQTETVRKHRAAGKADMRHRTAYGRAMADLRRRHPEEFAALLRDERYKLGLDPDGHRQGAA